MTSRHSDDELEEYVLRPFIVTRGRTRAAEGVAMESLVDRRGRHDDVADDVANSHQQEIWEALTTRMSVAEISAICKHPLGVVMVLISDMAELGLVEVYQTAATDDIQLVRKLIDGVRAL
jgi:hypothetical protein